MPRANNFAQHWEQRHPSIVAAVLAITLPFPVRDNKAPLPFNWEDACVPGRAQNCMQRDEYSISTSLEKFSMDVTDPWSFTHFNWFTTACVSTSEGGPQLIGGSATGIVTPLTSNSTAGDQPGTTAQSNRPSGPSLRTPLSRAHHPLL